MNQPHVRLESIGDAKFRTPDGRVVSFADGQIVSGPSGWSAVASVIDGAGVMLVSTLRGGFPFFFTVGEVEFSEAWLQRTFGAEFAEQVDDAQAAP